MIIVENKNGICCNFCSHNSTCKYKDTYSKMKDMLESAFNEFGNLEMKETDFMTFKDPSCKYFQRNSGSENYRNV